MIVITQVFLVVFLGLDSNLTRRVVGCDHRGKRATFSDLDADPTALQLLENWDFFLTQFWQRSVFWIVVPSKVTMTFFEQRTMFGSRTISESYENQTIWRLSSQVWQILLIMPPASLLPEEVAEENAVDERVTRWMSWFSKMKSKWFGSSAN